MGRSSIKEASCPGFIEKEGSASGSNLNPSSPLMECVREAMNEGLDVGFQGHYADMCSRDSSDLRSAGGINYMSGKADVTSFRTTKESEGKNPSIPGVNTSEGVSPNQSTNTVEVEPFAEQVDVKILEGLRRLPETPHAAASLSQLLCNGSTSRQHPEGQSASLYL